jgi:hypothetical protein
MLFIIQISRGVHPHFTSLFEGKFVAILYFGKKHHNTFAKGSDHGAYPLLLKKHLGRDYERSFSGDKHLIFRIF